MRHPETDIQKAVKKYLDKVGVLYNASCAGMKTTMKSAMVHKAMGSQKGFPDIFIYEPRGKWCGMALEIKAANGNPTTEQILWRDNLIKRGYFAEICPRFKTDKECFDWAITEIDKYFY